jgi:hypothetical protein
MQTMSSKIFQIDPHGLSHRGEVHHTIIYSVFLPKCYTNGKWE